MAENMARTAYEVQRDFAMSSGLRSEIIWDSLAPDQAYVLEQKLEDLIFDNGNLKPKELARRRKQLFDNVWMQRIYTNRTLLSAIIYVLVTDERDPALALTSTKYSCHPVIRTRKCVRADGGNSEGCCMIFIDEEGRVYGNWDKYLKNNDLPKGTMIAPSQGVYTFSNDEAEVQLTVQRTPAVRLKRKLLNISDKIVTIGSLMATVPVAAAMAVPVTNSILLGASMLGVSSAAYSAMRSATQLIDRHWHGQTTSLRNSEARSNWLGLAGGVAGLGATGACTAVNVMRSRAGSVPHVAVKGICLSSVIISGTGVLNGVYDLYVKISDDQPLDSYSVMQIASSLLIFTHSINNMRLAAKVTNGYSLRNELSHQSRKVFRRIVQESVMLQGKTGGGADNKMDILRLINDIPYKEALHSMLKIGSNMSAGNGILGAMSAVNVFPSFLRLDVGGQVSLDLEALVKQLGNKCVQHIGNFGSFTDVLDGLTRHFSEKAAQLLLQLTRNFIEENVDSIDRNLNTFVSTELVLYRMLKHCIGNYENCAVEFLEQRRHDILNGISNYFQSLQPQSQQSSRRRKCPRCHGVYYMCSL